MRINDLPILLDAARPANTVASHRKLGEDGVYATYAGSDLAYTIIRPGGLEEPKENVVQGPGALEISQVRRGVLIVSASTPSTRPVRREMRWPA